VPLFKLCPSKFDALKKENDTEATTNLKSYNSNSSISSSNSDSSNSTTTDETTSNNQIILEDDDDDDDDDDIDENEDVVVFKDNKAREIASSKKQQQQQQATSPTPLKEDQNEFLLLNKFQSSLREKIFKDDASSTQSDESIVSSNNRQDENLIILEICADCYQMMEGVTVNTTTTNTSTTPTENSKPQEHNNIQASSSSSSSTSSSSASTLEKPQQNLLKSIYRNNIKNGEMSASCSSDAIVMNSLSNVNIVNNSNEILITTNGSSKNSPMLSKKSFGKLQSHSTPSTSTSNLGAIIANKQNENELSQIALSVDDSSSSVVVVADGDLFAKNIRVTREKLTLDLQPVYSTTAKAPPSSSSS